MTDLRWLLDNVPEDSIEEHALTIEDAIKENEALSNLLSSLVDVELERDVAMSENQRLTKHVEDYETENVALKRIKEAAQRVADDESEGLIHFAVIGELRDALLAAEEQER